MLSWKPPSCRGCHAQPAAVPALLGPLGEPVPSGRRGGHPRQRDAVRPGPAEPGPAARPGPQVGDRRDVGHRDSRTDDRPPAAGAEGGDEDPPAGIGRTSAARRSAPAPAAGPPIPARTTSAGRRSCRRPSCRRGWCVDERSVTSPLAGSVQASRSRRILARQRLDGQVGTAFGAACGMAVTVIPADSAGPDRSGTRHPA